MLNIYGKYAPTLDKLLGQMMAQFEQLNKNYEKNTANDFMNIYVVG